MRTVVFVAFSENTVVRVSVTSGSVTTSVMQLFMFTVACLHGVWLHVVMSVCVIVWFCCMSEAGTVGVCSEHLTKALSCWDFSN